VHGGATRGPRMRQGTGPIIGQARPGVNERRTSHLNEPEASATGRLRPARR